MEISRTADAALELMTIIAGHPGSRTADLATLTGISADTCERRLHTLSCRGYVVLHSDESWGLGPKLNDLASRVPDRLVLAAREEVNALAERFGASVVIATAAVPNFTIRLEREGRAGPVRVEHFLGVEFGIWQAPPGLALLPAFDARTMAIVEQHTPDPRILHVALEGLRRTGVVVAPSDLMTGRTGVATPVRLANGAVIASLTLAFQEFDMDAFEDTRAGLLASAKQIAERYGKLSMGASVRRARQDSGR